MSKIQTIKIENFKAISEMNADFNGCTAIVTGSNNKGKTSFLRGIPDRIRFVRPEVMVKEGSTQGRGELTLDSGEKFVWEFNKDGKDTLQYITTEKAKRTVTVELGAKFFPKPFDIDKFLNSTPKEQSKQLQKVVGLDFAEIDYRYAVAYQNRTDKNRSAEKYQVKLTELMEVPKVDAVDLTTLQARKESIRQELNAAYLANKTKNEETRKAWEQAKTNTDNHVHAHNLEQSKRAAELVEINTAITTLAKLGYEVHVSLLTWRDKKVSEVGEQKTASDLYPAEPTYIPEMPNDAKMVAIDAEILAASEVNEKARQYKEYVAYKSDVETAKNEAKEANALVATIEQERLDMIRKGNFPKGIELTVDGITVDGLPLDRGQLSSSRIAIAALQIAALNIGEVKTLFFDASFLDRKSMNEVNNWAVENDFQLLIEKPSWDESEITYTLIQDTI